MFSVGPFRSTSRHKSRTIIVPWFRLLPFYGNLQTVNSLTAIFSESTLEVTLLSRIKTKHYTHPQLRHLKTRGHVPDGHAFMHHEYINEISFVTPRNKHVRQVIFKGNNNIMTKLRVWISTIWYNLEGLL